MIHITQKAMARALISLQKMEEEDSGGHASSPPQNSIHQDSRAAMCAHLTKQTKSMHEVFKHHNINYSHHLGMGGKGGNGDGVDDDVEMAYDGAITPCGDNVDDVD